MSPLEIFGVFSCAAKDGQSIMVLTLVHKLQIPRAGQSLFDCHLTAHSARSLSTKNPILTISLWTATIAARAEQNAAYSHSPSGGKHGGYCPKKKNIFVSVGPSGFEHYHHYLDIFGLVGYISFNNNMQVITSYFTQFDKSSEHQAGIFSSV